tara:strand:- start:196 stop:333 length:138 start_codon:yes stop_codon:yes gene_type:complete
MLKLEPNEVAMLIQMMEGAQIQGKDCIPFAALLEKLLKELKKFQS